MRLATVATCNLDQWAMDFDGNLARIERSIQEAKAQGARYRLGPELEIPGYGCEDHFLEPDTTDHSWEVLAKIIASPDLTKDILVDLGMPVLYKGALYNCRIFVLNGQIVLIRPKFALAGDGNYREPRYFAAWKKRFTLETMDLPDCIIAVHGQQTAPIGDAIIQLKDTSLASEICEELFTANSTHVPLYLDGVEIVSNGSGSHHQLRKLDARVELMKNATRLCGGVYMYANQQGCDGGRLYFDGCCMTFINGNCVAQGSQFSLKDIEVVSSTVDLDEVRGYRTVIASRSIQAADTPSIPRVHVDFRLTTSALSPKVRPSVARTVAYLCPEEEIAYGPACWLWDYLRRSGAGGFFLALSGGADSSATAAIVGSMCKLVVKECQEGNQDVIRDARRASAEPEGSTYVPSDAREFCSRILHTCYMGTVNSSDETRDRAKRLAEQVGAYHLDSNIDTIVAAFLTSFTALTGKTPAFKLHGGSITENLALQNIQARSRMVWGYLLAQLLLWTRGRPGGLLVLSSANVDESLRGYMTKYDCSSGDLNPIGSISKRDLKRFLVWGAVHLAYPVLSEIVEAPPTAELEPITADYVQSDEADMGMTYDELSYFGRMRKVFLSGPVSMFQKLTHEWKHMSSTKVAEKVKRFFYFYAINRHKMTTLTPSYHAESYSPDDNRFDHRQFLYNIRWPWQFRKVDEMAAKFDAEAAEIEALKLAAEVAIKQAGAGPSGSQ